MTILEELKQKLKSQRARLKMNGKVPDWRVDIETLERIVAALEQVHHKQGFGYTHFTKKKS